MNRHIEVGKNFRPRQPVFLDHLDQIIKRRIDEHRAIALSELRHEYPDELDKLTYITLHYPLSSLAQAYFIRVERGRKALKCFQLRDNL